MFQTEFAGTCTIHLHTQFLIPGSKGSSLVIALKLKAKYKFRSGAMLFYMVGKYGE
jgi:hypothetical protein